MATPDEAYSEGYEKGRNEGLAGNTAEAIFGMMKDDPGGHYAAGYRDGGARKEFKPPSAQAPVRKPAAEVNPFDDKVAIKAVCPNCGALDWFEWKFLGRLTDPICGHSWYVDSGTYTGMQVRAAFVAGGKGAKYFTSGVGGQGAWIGRALGWFIGVILGLGIRLEFGILMIPIQAFAGLFQAKKTAADVVTRFVVLAVTLGGIGVGVYAIQHAPRQPTIGIDTVTDATAPTLNLNVNDVKAMIVGKKWYGLVPKWDRGQIYYLEYNLKGEIRYFGNGKITTASGDEVSAGKTTHELPTKSTWELRDSTHITQRSGNFQPEFYQIVRLDNRMFVLRNDHGDLPYFRNLKDARSYRR